MKYINNSTKHPHYVYFTDVVLIRFTFKVKGECVEKNRRHPTTENYKTPIIDETLVYFR